MVRECVCAAKPMDVTQLTSLAKNNLGYGKCVGKHLMRHLHICVNSNCEEVDIIEVDRKEIGVKIWSGFKWLRLESSVRLL
jgi:hypothetical protein